MVWQAAKAADGRTYYWNTETKETRWVKPADFVDTPVVQAAPSAPVWKEFRTPEGKPYYYNAATQQTVWNKPEGFDSAAPQNQSTLPQKPLVPTPLASSNALAQYPDRNRPRDDFDRRDRPQGFGQSTFVGVAATSNEPEYGTLEEANAAFVRLLKRTGVQSDWSWVQTMRATIQDREFRAIKDPKDRILAFEQYIADARAQDKEKEKERLEKLRQDFTTMLKSHPEIKHYSRWSTIQPIIEGETIFRSTSNDTERRQLFEEYRAELRKSHAEHIAKTRQLALAELSDVLQSLNLEPYTRWTEFKGILESNDRFSKDDKFRTLTQSDILTAFEQHIKALERAFNDKHQFEKSQTVRRERKRREDYQELLEDLRSARKIKFNTMWKDIQPLIEDDPRYDAMLGQQGSTPLDFFWDMIEEEDRAVRKKRDPVLDVLDAKRFEMTPETTLDEFLAIMESDETTNKFDKDELSYLFKGLLEKVIKRAEEDKHHAERQQRKAVDALRSRIRRLDDPPVRFDDSWEKDVKPRVEDLEEYHAVETDELRRTAFDKVIRRLKEKYDADEQDRARAEQERKRERERESRRRRDDRGYTRSPEADPYEADRRRAIADRERNYRRGSAAGLSPPPTYEYEPRRRDTRDRLDDRDYRDRERDRHDRGRLGGASPYERERRVREVDRERGYVNRADPRDVAKELDYGESGRAGSMTESTTSRRRRSVDSDAKRDHKRLKMNGGSKSPQDVEMKEEVALQSGSEEGEIEEVDPKAVAVAVANGKSKEDGEVENAAKKEE